MNKFDKIVMWCLTVVACSFWIVLAWVYATNQPESSFFVGPAVAVGGAVIVIDAALLCIALLCGGYAIITKKVAISEVSQKWLLMVFLTALSFYLEVQIDLHLHPFFRR
ncbi:hypothetical protein [Rhodoferax sp. GW822-FHT02A01]|uniref:hypothetical protein n=1 Tax=Rhodoferax sp. GW822-FHT02A01 TaxID=3141537 RepID=UPI00315C8394